MADFELVMRGGTVATAGDVVVADVVVRNGRVVAIGEALAAGESKIDAVGKIVTPGGVDSHCHLDQPMSDGSVMADDFESGTISAAFGGTTTVLPFACQMRGQSLRPVVEDYHRRTEGKAVIDYAFHLIISDPAE
jgi:dihydropyrimidinase